jgi:gamma-glutamyl-gamma-aminobutyrate hydrolase PuuD
MARPAIGVCLALQRASWGAWDLDAFLAPRPDVDAVHRAGGLALMLAPDRAQADDPDELLDRVDGLLLAGDADPDLRSHEAVHGAGGAPASIGRAERDAFELALVRRALERDLPFLGIGRGTQVMCIARGGAARIGGAGDRLVVTARADGDARLEALELAGNRFAVGARRHPGEDGMSRLVAALVAAAAAGRDGAG